MMVQSRGEEEHAMQCEGNEEENEIYVIINAKNVFESSPPASSEWMLVWIDDHNFCYPHKICVCARRWKREISVKSNWKKHKKEIHRE